MSLSRAAASPPRILPRSSWVDSSRCGPPASCCSPFAIMPQPISKDPDPWAVGGERLPRLSYCVSIGQRLPRRQVRRGHSTQYGCSRHCYRRSLASRSVGIRGIPHTTAQCACGVDRSASRAGYITDERHGRDTGLRLGLWICLLVGVGISFIPGVSLAGHPGGLVSGITLAALAWITPAAGGPDPERAR